MTRKLIAETRIRYKETTYEVGNTFLCDDADIPDMLREKLAKEYPKPSPEVQARLDAEEIEAARIKSIEAKGILNPKTKLIGFVPHQSIDLKQIAAGTRIRVLNIVKHLEDCVVSYKYDELKECKVVIFQARWLNTDIELARKLYVNGAKLIFDTTDPHWDTVNFDNTGIRKKALDRILEYVSVVTFPTEKLKESFLKYRKDKRIEVIPDCIDLEKHTRTKQHRDKKQFTIIWFGCRSNICSIDLARKDLERLGKEFKIKFLAVYDRGHEAKVGPFKNLEIERREWSDEATIDAILESDVAINPRYNNWKKYKSRNKTRKALALGVPCVEGNYYKEIKKYLESAKLRNRIGKKGKAKVAAYGSKIIAERLTTLCKELVQRPKTKGKKIAVITAITTGWDNLHEPKYYDKEVDYFAFMDTPAKSIIWQIIPIDYTHFKQPRLAAKVYKILTHKFVDYDYIVWVDGAVVITGSITEMINKFLKNADMALFKHRFRDCAYEEMRASFLNGFHAIGEPNIIRENQRKKYKIEGMPAKAGLYECTFILRRNNKKVIKFNNEWMSEVITNSASDQVPFMYTLWKNLGIKIAAIKPGDSRKSKWAYHIEHEGRDNVRR